MWSAKSTDVILTSVLYKSDTDLSQDGSNTSSNTMDKSEPKVNNLEANSNRTSRTSLETLSTEHERKYEMNWNVPGTTTSEVNSIAVIGTGDFGRALAAKMVQSGFKVCFGSRNPNRNREFIESVGAELTTIPEAILGSDIVIAAIPKDFYNSLPTGLLAGKTVVDVSNRTTVHRKMDISQAEYLQGLLPRSAVVKAFNVLSAYVLENGGSQGTKEVFYAGDIHSSKEQVLFLIRSLGFTPVDRGALKSAREIEDIPVQRFPKWKSPMIVSSIVFLIFFLLAIGKFQICWTLSWDGHWHWDRWNSVPLTTLNSALSCHALTMLALCYLPGVFAAYIQIWRGTKYSRFPKWLDGWLKMRKQLGLLMLFSASLHACLMMAVFSPKTQGMAFEPPQVIRAEVNVEGNWTEPQEVQIWSNTMMKWRGECFLTTGVVAFVFAILLGITSLPSVSASLSWKEFAFIQSNLGWLCLILTCAHDLFYGWPFINGPSCGIPSTFQYVMYIPGLTILLKIPILLPGLSCHLEKIRGGWERNSIFKNTVSGHIMPNQLTDSIKNNTYMVARPENFKRPGHIINVRST